MSNASPKNYFRLANQTAFLDASAKLPRVTEQPTNIDDLRLSGDLAAKLRPGDGIVIAQWSEAEQVGHVSHLCVVTSVDINDSAAKVVVVAASITLKPNPAGRRWWRNEYFKFAESVRERYMLDDLFAEHFPQYTDIDLGQVIGTRKQASRQYQKVAGYIYVLQSKYGYKIGKAVSIKNRTRIFEVKLPFKFDLVVSEYVENYSKAEADLHRKYANKRLEGEWFELDEADVEDIRELLIALQGESD